MLALSDDQMMLRGSSLRNTQWIYGFVIYTGHDSKMMMNSTKAKAKSSKIEKLTNWLILLVFSLQILLCIFAGVYATAWLSINRTEFDTYM
jgi:phospholipid-transporting ATPase